MSLTRKETSFYDVLGKIPLEDMELGEVKDVKLGVMRRVRVTKTGKDLIDMECVDWRGRGFGGKTSIEPGHTMRVLNGVECSCGEYRDGVKKYHSHHSGTCGINDCSCGAKVVVPDEQTALILDKLDKIEASISKRTLHQSLESLED